MYTTKTKIAIVNHKLGEPHLAAQYVNCSLNWSYQNTFTNDWIS